MIMDELRNIIRREIRAGVPKFVIRNILKEYLQFPVLNFIYNSKEYRSMIFTGGSCLRVCFGLPRFSEDLDFDLQKGDWEGFSVDRLAKDVREYFRKKLLFAVETKVQGDSRIYLKFAVLRELELANRSESDLLYVKIETEVSSFEDPVIEVQPVFRYGYNFVVRRYDLRFLMTGKIRAIFSRNWFSGDDNEIDVKGRDFYDLYWYLDRGIEPDYKSLEKDVKIRNKEELIEQLGYKIKKELDPQKLSYDLKNFLRDQDFVSDFCGNYEEIILRKLEGYRCDR